MNREYRQQSGIDLRGLTGDGNLSSVVDTAGPEQRREIFRKSGEIIYPLVYQHLTRRHEIDRGHFLCAVAMNRLEPECLDRLHDDAEAAVCDLIRNARVPIHSIEGWVASRL